MARAQVQLPDDLYERAKRFGAEHDLSLAETVRRALELLLEQEPAPDKPKAEWKLPQFDGGGIKIPLEKLRDVIADEESLRSLPRE